MQKLNKCIACLALSVVCVGAANAQHSGVTLEQAIETARSIKAGELGLRAASPSGSDATASLVKPAHAAIKHPKVWSITGVAQDLIVEVVYEGKVNTLSLAKNQVNVGPWTLVGLSERSAEFAYLSKGKRAAEKVQVVEMFPPASATQMQGYFEAPVTLPSSVVGAAPSSRTPLPLDLMRTANLP